MTVRRTSYPKKTLHSVVWAQTLFEYDLVLVLIGTYSLDRMENLKSIRVTSIDATDERMTNESVSMFDGKTYFRTKFWIWFYDPVAATANSLRLFVIFIWHASVYGWVQLIICAVKRSICFLGRTFIFVFAPFASSLVLLLLCACVSQHANGAYSCIFRVCAVRCACVRVWVSSVWRINGWEDVVLCVDVHVIGAWRCIVAVHSACAYATSSMRDSR